jgi:hypothetical protein
MTHRTLMPDCMMLTTVSVGLNTALTIFIPSEYRFHSYYSCRLVRVQTIRVVQVLMLSFQVPGTHATNPSTCHRGLHIDKWSWSLSTRASITIICRQHRIRKALSFQACVLVMGYLFHILHRRTQHDHHRSGWGQYATSGR